MVKTDEIIWILRGIGIATLLICTTLGTYLNYFISPIGWTEIISAISIIAIIDWRNLLSFNLHISKWLVLILIFEIYCFYFGAANRSTISLMLKNNLPVIAFILALSTHNKNNEVFNNKIIDSTFYISLVSTLLALYCINDTSIYNADYQTFEESNGARIDTFTIVMGPTVNLITCLYKKFNTKCKLLNNLIPIILILLDIYITLCTSKRTPTIRCCVFLAMFFIKNYNGEGIRLLKKLLIICLIGSITLVSLTSDISEKIETKISRIENGMGGIMTGEESDTGSSAFRYYIRQRTMNKIYNNLSIKTFFFGNGPYTTGQVDCQPLELFGDCGLIAIIFYTYLTIIPIVIFFRKNTHGILCFLSLYCGIETVSCLIAGTAHGFYRWFGFVLFFHFIYLEKKEIHRLRMKNEIGASCIENSEHKKIAV